MKTRIWAVFRNEYLHIIRDPRTLILTLLLPLFLLVMDSYALNFDIKNIPAAVYNLDHSASSRELLDKVSQSGYFDLKKYITREEEVNQLLDAGQVQVVISIPKGFSTRLAAGEKASVQVLVDGSNPTLAKVAFGYLNMVIRNYSSQITIASLRRYGVSISDGFPPIKAEQRVWYNPELKSVNFIVPGLIAIIMMTLTASETCIAVVREKERRTIEHIIVSPVRSHELVIGKIGPYVVVAAIATLLISTAAVLWFGVPFRGSVLLFAVCTIIYVTLTLGLGLFISTLTDSQQVAMLTSFLATVLPAMMLSGFVFPIASMPKVLQYVTYLVPARYFLQILRGIFLKGAGLSTLWPEILTLTVYALVIISLSAFRFRKSLG